VDGVFVERVQHERNLLLPVERRGGDTAATGQVASTRRRVRTVTIDESTLAPGIDEVRGLVSPDGGEVELEGVEGSTVRLRLVLENAHCVECVMPRSFLEQVALDVFRRNGAAADAVVIDDPREHPDFVMPEH
jgi:hypothetical protein